MPIFDELLPLSLSPSLSLSLPLSISPSPPASSNFRGCRFAEELRHALNLGRVDPADGDSAAVLLATALSSDLWDDMPPPDPATTKLVRDVRHSLVHSSISAPPNPARPRRGMGSTPPHTRGCVLFCVWYGAYAHRMLMDACDVVAPPKKSPKQ